MKSAIAVAVAVLLSVLVPGGVESAQPECAVPDTMDASKVKADRFSSFALNACWPTGETIEARRYRGSLDVEVADLLKMLDRVIRQECLPQEAELKQKVVGLTEFRRHDDCLVLKYKTKAGFDMGVQDAGVLYLFISPPAAMRRDLSSVDAFVEEVANAVLRVPVFGGESTPRPRTFVSILDVGKSKVGRLHYGPEQMSEWDWYSNIYWWSDGKQVLFAISKLTKKDYAERAGRARANTTPRPPRRFASRSADSAK